MKAVGFSNFSVWLTEKIIGNKIVLSLFFLMIISFFVFMSIKTYNNFYVMYKYGYKDNIYILNVGYYHNFINKLEGYIKEKGLEKETLKCEGEFKKSLMYRFGKYGVENDCTDYLGYKVSHIDITGNNIKIYLKPYISENELKNNFGMFFNKTDITIDDVKKYYDDIGMALENYYFIVDDINNVILVKRNTK